MHLNFTEIADAARVWIYQANRKLTKDEASTLRDAAKRFTVEWAAHGNALASSAEVLHDLFLVIAVDESHNDASGCSIDASVKFVKEAEKALNVNFFDRTSVAYQINDEIHVESLQNLKQSISEGKINRSTPVFNNLVATKKEMDQNWITKAENTWLKKYFASN